MKTRLQQLAVGLRQRQTDAERKLWFEVRDRRFIVELGGSQHNAEVDRPRDKWLQSQGFRILRFWNNDVMSNLNGILQVIKAVLEPSPACGKGQGEGVAA